MSSPIHKILSAVVAATLGLGSMAAYAQPHPEVIKRAVQARAHAVQPGHHGPAVRPQQGRAPVPPIAARVQAARGAGPNHNWHQGGHLPPQYRTQHYIVNDWRTHRAYGLYAPPRGHHWVQNGGDYLLVAIATGVITSIILNSAH